MRGSEEEKLSVVSGLCWRYDTGTAALGKYLADGGVGEVQAIQTCYNTQELWSFPRKPEGATWSFRCATGSITRGCRAIISSRQNVHNLDRAALFMKGEYPVKVTSPGRTAVAHG